MRPALADTKARPTFSRWPKAWRIREAHFPLEITFTRPKKTACISVTGPWCGLDCAHCNGRYLRGMMPVEEADTDGATTCLISGGCDQQGRIPFQPHLPALKRLCQGKRTNWHVGLIKETDLVPLVSLIDVVSFDFVSDGATIHEVYGLDRDPHDYVKTYQMLRRHVSVVPHITIGLKGGVIGPEYEALTLLKELGVDEALVFIILIPTRGTTFADVEPPPPAQVADLLAHARILFPDLALHLGCMRPHGAYRDQVDQLAVQTGINKIVNPASSARKLAQEMGLRVLWKEACCVF